MGKQTILVASQNQPQAKLIGECLINAGYELLPVDQGRSAMEAILTQKPDLVILDRKLPDLSAFALTRMIRSNLEGKDLPIILTGLEQNEPDLMMGLEAGADLCLTEPFHPKLFIARVRALIRRCQVYGTLAKPQESTRGNHA